MVFGQAQNALCHDSAEGSEITGVGMELHRGHFVDEPIKALFEAGQHGPLAPPVLVGCHHIAVGIGVQNVEHFQHHLGPLLQVRVDDGDVIAGGVLKARVNARLLAEVPGKAHHPYGTFLLGVEPPQLLHGTVGAAIVDKDDLIVKALPGKGGNHRRLEICHIFFFIVAGNDQR